MRSNHVLKCSSIMITVPMFFIIFNPYSPIGTVVVHIRQSSLAPSKICIMGCRIATALPSLSNRNTVEGHWFKLLLKVELSSD